MEWLRQVLGQALTAFKGMTAAQRASMIVMGLTVAIALGVVIVLGARPKYVILASGLDQKKLSEVVGYLDGVGEEYRTDPGRGAVLVAQDRKASLQKRLLADQVMSLEEVFSYADFITQTGGIHVSNRHRDDVLRIALQNELKRMIEGLDGIESARVEIQKEKDNEFGGWQEQSVGAAVTLALKRGVKMDQPMANTIIDLISSAVRNADPEKIAVVDSRNWGQKFRRQDPKSVFVVGSTRWDLTKAVNDYYRDKIKAFIDQTGYESAVTVDCTLDLDGTRKTLYTVDGEKTAIVSLEKRKSTHIGETPPAGPTGMGNNSPEFGAAAGVGSAAVGTGRPSETKEDEQKLVQDHERMLSETVKTPGNISEIKVAAVLFHRVEEKRDEAGRSETVVVAPSKEELDEWRGLIAKAAGLKDADSDKIMVASMRPPRLELSAGAGDEEAWDRVASYWPAARIAGIMLLATFSLFLLYGLGKRAATNRPVAAAMQPSASAQNDRSLGLPASEAEDMQLHEVQKRLRAFVEQDPRKVAGLVKRWLVREG